MRSSTVALLLSVSLSPAALALPQSVTRDAATSPTVTDAPTFATVAPRAPTTDGRFVSAKLAYDLCNTLNGLSKLMKVGHQLDCDHLPTSGPSCGSTNDGNDDGDLFGGANQIKAALPSSSSSGSSSSNSGSNGGPASSSSGDDGDLFGGANQIKAALPSSSPSGSSSSDSGSNDAPASSSSGAPDSSSGSSTGSSPSSSSSSNGNGTPSSSDSPSSSGSSSSDSSPSSGDDGPVYGGGGQIKAARPSSSTAAPSASKTSPSSPSSTASSDSLENAGALIKVALNAGSTVDVKDAEKLLAGANDVPCAADCVADTLKRPVIHLGAIPTGVTSSAPSLASSTNAASRLLAAVGALEDCDSTTRTRPTGTLTSALGQATGAARLTVGAAGRVAAGLKAKVAGASTLVHVGLNGATRTASSALRATAAVGNAGSRVKGSAGDAEEMAHGAHVAAEESARVAEGSAAHIDG